ncbi:MAG TPA: cupredoxin domain-containing protein [Thermoanaerobaculia bacterium]|nr:cupredoxin domain-containing protein [Thermoanaerobaculia bacterium]
MRKTIQVLGAALVMAFAGVVAAAETQTVRVTVSGMSYSPAEVVVEKGVPVRMEFTRDDKPGCGGKVLFPELEIERDLPAGKTTVVEFTPKKDGELNFTCGMKMMKGTIVVRSN